MKAVIIAGGTGTRLRPLTYTTPKPMVPLLGKPFMQHQLALLRRHGVSDVIINLHYLPEVIQNYFGDGRDHHLPIRYSLETKPLGTAGAVKLAEEHLGSAPVVIINGDILTDVDLQDMLAFHLEKKAVATIALARVADPTAYGLVITDAEGQVQQFLEKPSRDEVIADTVNAGVYILDPQLLRFIPTGEAYSFERGLFPLLLQLRERVYGYHTQRYWLDIGSPEKYQQAHTDILQGRLRIPLDAERRTGDIWVERDVWVDESAELKGPIYLAKGSRIGKRVSVTEFSVIGPGVVVDDDARVAQSIVGEGSVIGQGAFIGHSLIGSHCVIGAASQVPEGLLLGDGSSLACGTNLNRFSSRLSA